MANSIIKGEQVTSIKAPLIVPGKKSIDTELLGVWFARLVHDFPDIRLTLDEPVGKEEVATLASVFQEKADRLKPVNQSKETLHQALDAYKKWLHANFLTPPEKEKERRTSQTGVKQGERVDRLKKHVKDLPLSALGTKEIEDVVKCWANRPMSSRDTAYAVTVCKHQIRLWKHFVKWLHKEPSFSWKKPADLEWDRVKILEHTHETQARMTAEQVETYSKDELKTLWDYGTDLHRIMMLFGGLCFLLNGHMLVGVWKNSMIARIGQEQADEALLEPHVKAMDITGKPMKGWVMVEPDGVADDGAVKVWVQRAVKFVGKLPAK